MFGKDGSLSDIRSASSRSRPSMKKRRDRVAIAAAAGLDFVGSTTTCASKAATASTA